MVFRTHHSHTLTLKIGALWIKTGSALGWVLLFTCSHFKVHDCVKDPKSRIYMSQHIAILKRLVKNTKQNQQGEKVCEIKSGKETQFPRLLSSGVAQDSLILPAHSCDCRYGVSSSRKAQRAFCVQGFYWKLQTPRKQANVQHTLYCLHSLGITSQIFQLPQQREKLLIRPWCLSDSHLLANPTRQEHLPFKAVTFVHSPEFLKDMHRISQNQKVIPLGIHTRRVTERRLGDWPRVNLGLKASFPLLDAPGSEVNQF